MTSAPSPRKKSVVDIVWRDRKPEVEAEMKELHRIAGGEGAPSAADEFRLRPTAAKNIYGRLDDSDRQKILDQKNNPSENVNPPDIQQM